MVGVAIAASSLVLHVVPASGSERLRIEVAAPASTDARPQVAEWRLWLKGLDREDLDPRILGRLNQAFEDVIEPTALVPGGMPAGEAYLLTWEFNEHHLELELYSDHWEWFYRNLDTGKLAGEEYLVGQDFSSFLRRLKKYAR